MRHLLIAVLIAAGCHSHPPAPESTSPVPTHPQIEVGGFELTLEPATSLFAPGFARYVAVDGVLEQRAPRFSPSCYWNGRVRGAAHSRVAVRACRPDFADVTGIVLVDGDGWYVAEGAVRPLQSREGECGTQSSPTSLTPPPAAAIDPAEHTHRAALSSGQPRFIEMVIAEDAQVAAQPGSVGDTVLMVHLAAALYDNANFEDRVLPVLVAAVDTGGSDPWGSAPMSGGEALSGPYLDNFNAWLENSGSLPDYDVAALFTGWDLDGLTVGLANVEGACDPTYSGVLVDAVGEDDAVSQTLAHEIGHTLGLEHDGTANNCDGYDFIMTSIYTEGGPYPTEFSTCSVADGDRWLRSGAAACIDFFSQPSHDAPNCGNGLVESGEQCDCGPEGCAGRDPCCDEASCRFTSGATCSVTDGCCDESTCTPFASAANVVCRAARSECDAAETCNGGPTCPTDTYQPTGDVCTDDQGWDGACINGICATRGSICEALTDDYVLDPIPYDEMCADAGCDVMECVYDGGCVFTSYGTPDGTPCGTGQQCWRGSCVNSSTLPGADGCSAPDLDSDNDGTRDCDDDCPLDPDATEAPCATPDPGPDNNSSGNNGGSGTSNNPGGGPNDQTNGGNPGDDDPIIIVDSGSEGGCATSDGQASWWLVGFMLIMSRVRRRQARAEQVRG